MRTPRVCDRVVDRLRGLSLRLKSEKSCIDNSTKRSFFVLLEAVLCRHVISHTSRKGRIVSVSQFACSSFLGSSFIHQGMSVRSFMNRIVRVSNRSFACRTGLVAPSAFVRTFWTMLVHLRGRRTNVPKMRLFFVPLPCHGNGRCRL